MASAIVYTTRTSTDTQPVLRRIIEKSGQTFLLGVPVMIDTVSGGMQEWDGTTVATGIAGFSKEPASNLASTGVPKTLTLGTAPYQPASAIIPVGAPLNDGRVEFATSIGSNVFHGQVGPAQTTAVTDRGKQYGMTKDTDGHWYVDKSKSTVGTNTVVQVVDLDQFDTTRGVIFMVTPAAAQLTQ